MYNTTVMKVQKAYVVVPVFNESKYIEDFFNNLIAEVKNIRSIKKVIFVNDGSTDNTYGKLKVLTNSYKNFSVLNHKVNKGKGCAMLTGLRFAAKDGADAVIFMDGDGQHNPKFLGSFLRKLELAPIVFGFRLLAKNAPVLRRTGNLIAGFIIHNLFNIKRKDLLCGFMALRKDVFNKVIWRSNGYGVEAEISAVVGRKKIEFDEVFVSTIYLDRRKGVTLWHAFRILLHLPSWYFSVK